MSNMAPPFEFALSLLVGKPLWGIIAGWGTGSNVSMHFGQKLRLSKPIQNLHLSEDCRMFSGEYGLFLQGVAWRVLHAGVVICDFNSDNRTGCEMQEGMGRLKDKFVVSVLVDPADWAFKIEFEKDLVLHGAAALAFDDVPERRFDFFMPGFVYSVDEEGSLAVATRCHQV